MSTAAYTAQADAFGRRVQWMVEIELDRCSLSYTTAPCTASDAGNGSRCYYSFATCQDSANFTRTTRIYRFCLNEVPFPDTTGQVWPLLKKIVPIPQRIDPQKLFTYPEKVTLDFALDYNPPPIDADKTLHNTARAGEFWRNMRARHPNYSGRPLRVYRGFYANGFTVSDFDQIGPDYKITEFQIASDGCRIVAESPLADLEKRKIPFTISEDNTLQTTINSAATTVAVLDASEYPDPTDYTLNDIYVQIDSEIMLVTAVDTGTDELTVDRAQWGTTAASHTAGAKVAHVVVFGVDNGTSAATETYAATVIRNMLEWAGVVTADVDEDSFTDVTTDYWPEADSLAILRKPETIAKLVQPIRESRGLILFIDSTGKWALQSAAPSDTSTTLTDEHFVLDSVEVSEDDESRLTRVGLWFDPNTEQPKDTKDFDQGVLVIDTELETVNNYGDVRDRTFLDQFLSASTPIANVRNVARRILTRLRRGLRMYTFRLDIKDASLNVGDHRLLQTRHVLDVDGEQEVRPVLITAKREVSPAVTEYEAMDTNYSGRYLRIGPDTMAEAYNSATEADKSYGYWGDTDNRLGTRKVAGYIFW